MSLNLSFYKLLMTSPFFLFPNFIVTNLAHSFFDINFENSWIIAET